VVTIPYTIGTPLPGGFVGTTHVMRHDSRVSVRASVTRGSLHLPVYGAPILDLSPSSLTIEDAAFTNPRFANFGHSLSHAVDNTLSLHANLADK
jgi:hypothetical protein